ncbi:hypothetical protein OL229_21445 [Neisseriaceae bacterium JH1-16]|nr:hypothetical protein [Neisseriaceae bacterium JH1-16]
MYDIARADPAGITPCCTPASNGVALTGELPCDQAALMLNTLPRSKGQRQRQNV